MRDAAEPNKEKTMTYKHPAGAFTTPDRDQILARYWELANLDPEDTKGNITGQLNALDTLCEELRLKPVETNRPGSQEIYRSAWMAGSPRAN